MNAKPEERLWERVRPLDPLPTFKFKLSVVILAAVTVTVVVFFIGIKAGMWPSVAGVLSGDNPGYRRWDWKRNVSAEFHRVNAKRDIVVEGSGCLSRSNRELATFAVWVRLDQVERKRRAIARDGATYHEHWDRWAVQEQTFFARERPDTLADAIVDGRTGELAFRADYPLA